MEKKQIKRRINAGPELNYDYVCSASGLGFIRVYSGYLRGDINDALNEILHQDWFFDCETNDFITADKLFEICDIALQNYYKNSIFSSFDRKIFLEKAKINLI